MSDTMFTDFCPSCGRFGLRFGVCWYCRYDERLKRRCHTCKKDTNEIVCEACGRVTDAR